MSRSPWLFVSLFAVACTSGNGGRTSSSGGSNGATGGQTGTSGSTNGTSGGTSGTATTGATGATGGTNGGVDPGTDPNCGVQNFTLAKGLPPDLLIVLDKSGSMSDPPNMTSMSSKWDEMTAAINSVVGTLQGQIKWGLEMFPSDDSCGATNIDVPIGLMNATAITGAIGAKMPGGSTPTADAVHEGGTYLSTVSDMNPKYLVLATDGDPNCSSGMTAPGMMCSCPSGTTQMGMNCCVTTPFNFCIPCTIVSGGGIAGGPDEAGAEQAVTDVAVQGVHTFVIGIATDSTTEGVLNQMAINGKEARSGTQKYYPVSSQADLVNTINMIAGQIISCSFGLTMAPMHPENVSVEVDGATVPKDANHADGWDFGPNDGSIQFYGTWCTNLQTGAAMTVQAIFGCGPVS